MQYYLVLSVIIWGYLGIIWNKADSVNLGFKIVFIAMAVSALVFALQAYGFIVKA